MLTNGVSFAIQTCGQRGVARRRGLPEQHKSRSGQVSKPAKAGHRESDKDIRSIDSYVALQEMPARWMMTSVAESSQNDIVISVEKD